MATTPTINLEQTPTEPLGFAALVATQLLGVFNDNLYKMVVSLLAIDAAIIGGGGSAYLSLTGVLFVVPYLLFSGYAGFLADRFDKRRVLIVTKVIEIGLMGLATAALVTGRIELLLVTLFLVATQATFFSPAKYAILPEIVEPEYLARANGWLESSRYLTIIVGTVSGGVLLTVWRDRLDLIGLVLLAVAVAGLSFSLLIGRPSQVIERGRFRLSPWHEMLVGIRQILSHPVLAIAVGGLTAFDFLCTLAMLDVLLVGKTVMSASDLQIGLLGAGMAIGAGAGSIIAGRLAGSRTRIGVALFGMVGVGSALVLLAALSPWFSWALIVTVPLGFFGGFVVVPLNAQVQQRASSSERGRVIAGANFLSMMGCLLASGSLWLLHDLLSVPAPAVLAVAGGLAACLALIGARYLLAARFALELPGDWQH